MRALWSAAWTYWRWSSLARMIATTIWFALVAPPCLIACSASFSDITGLTDGAKVSDWFALFDDETQAHLGDQLETMPANARGVVRSHGQRIRITQEPRGESGDEYEQLISVKLVLDASIAAPAAVPAPMHAPSSAPMDSLTASSTLSTPSLPVALDATSTLPTLETDSVSGLPARQTMVNKFQGWLQSANTDSRYVAMMVDLSDSTLNEDTKSHTKGLTSKTDPKAQPLPSASSAAVDRTLQDLAVYRAADRLSRTLSSDTLLGRLSDDRLLIIRELEADEAPRMLAKGIRRSLGSLGGLLDSPKAVRINTVNVSAKQGASAEGLVTRLENR